MGARLPTRKAGVDQDMFDPYCDHLLVRDGDSNEVVGTYRILSPEQAKKIGGFYSQSEFDLTRIAHLSDHMAEVGRSYVHPDYRSGATITLLWAGLAEYMITRGYDYLIVVPASAWRTAVTAPRACTVASASTTCARWNGAFSRAIRCRWLRSTATEPAHAAVDQGLPAHGCLDLW